MRKFVISALALCMGFATVNAQITTGESSAQVVSTGNRAEAGNFGLYLGATAAMFEDLMNVDDAELKALPLINFKYMASDQFELRLGLEWWTSSTGSKSTGEVNEEGLGYPKGDFSTKERNKFTKKYLYPGFAYHFSNTNILDVYVGAELPIGWEVTSDLKYADYKGKDLDLDTKTKSTEFNVGLGAFVGLQAYVANLPLAVGVEYGISSLKTISSSKVITDEDQDYEAPIESKSNGNNWKVGHQARLTFTYFFKL